MLEYGGGVVHFSYRPWTRLLGSRTSLNPSPNMLMPNTVILIAIPGKNIIHGAIRIEPLASLMMFPQLGVGGRPGPEFKNPVHLTEYWSTVTQNGAKGDPTKATAEKGRRVLDAAAKELVEILTELKARGVRKRVPHQSSKQ